MGLFTNVFPPTDEEKRIKQRKLFQEYKTKVLEKFPTARTFQDTDGKYYVGTINGKKVIPEEMCISNRDTIYDAWKDASESIWYEHIIDRHNFDTEYLFEAYGKPTKKKEHEK